MARKEIGSVWDRSNRNAINENFRELYGLKDVADSAKSEAGHAVQTANYAKTKAESVQAQFNQVVIEGDSSVEAAQARVDAEGKSYPTLKARLDAKETEFSSQLAQIVDERLQFVTYAMFGVNSDKKYFNPATGKYYLDSSFTQEYTHNDGIEIKAAHDFANQHNLPIINPKGEYLLTEPLNIVIQTDVDWGKTVFHIDESQSKTSPSHFLVYSSKSKYTATLTPEEKTNILSSLKPGVKIIPALSRFKNCLINFKDENDRIGFRYGYNTSWAREELIFVEENGKIIGDVAWPFSDFTSVDVYPCDDYYLSIKGSTLLFNGASNPNLTSGTISAFMSINRSRVRIERALIGLEKGASDELLMAKAGVYVFNTVYDVSIRSARIIPRGSQTVKGTYSIGGARVLKINLEDITAEGNVDQWGVIGTNFMKDVIIQRCNMNRFDVHYHCWNLMVKDTNFGVKGLTVTGGGLLYLDNVSSNAHNNNYITFRDDYGSTWQGDIKIRNGRLFPFDDSVQSSILSFLPFNYNYRYKIQFGYNIFVDNFVFDYNDSKNSEIALLIDLQSWAMNTNVDRIGFPTNIHFKDIRVDGRDKGIRFMYVNDPMRYQLEKNGGYTTDGITPNCYMTFENIQGERFSRVNPASFTDTNMLLMGNTTRDYIDSKALYPKIDIRNCGESFVIHPKIAVADITIHSTTICAVDAFEGTPGRSRINFVNCDFKANVTGTGDILSLEVQYGTSFINCTFHPPIIDGVLSTTVASVGRYAVIVPNYRVKYDHINTKLSKGITTTTPLTQQYIEMLKSHSSDEPELVTLQIGASTSRPNNVKVGYYYFDTTLNKPIWCKVSGSPCTWVDSTGIVV